MEPIFVKPYEWRGRDEKYGYYINIGGYDDKGRTVLLRVRYFPWIYVKLNEKADMYEILSVLERNPPCKHDVETRMNVYKYKSGSKPTMLLKLEYRLAADAYKAKNYLKKLKYTVCEHDKEVDNICKLRTDYDLLPCGWMKVSKYTTAMKKMSFFECEYTTVPEALSPCDDSVSSKFPVPVPSVAIFDIEVNAKNRNAMPKAYVPEDIVFLIVIMFKKAGKVETHAICTEGTKPVDGAIIYKVATEKDGIDKFCELIMKLDPTVIAGHNIFGFDLPYSDLRLGRTNSVWQQISRYKNYESKIELIEWSSSAYSDNQFNTLDCPGRIFIDTYPVIKRGNVKLLSYTLEMIANHFLKKGKVKISPQQIFELYGTKDPENIKKIIEYCIQDCALVLELFEKLYIWIDLSEFANVVRTNMFDVFTRGQGIQCFNQEYYELRRKGYFYEKIVEKGMKYKGALIFFKKAGVYKYAMCFDFAKLYPSIIIAYNLCYTTLVDFDDPISDNDCHVFDWVEEDKDGKEQHHRYRFVKKHIREGILPALLTKLADARDASKAMMKKTTDAILKVIYNKRQEGQKISANSVYGNKGMKKGAKIPCQAVAICTTYIGRESNTKSSNYLKKNYGASIVYGDTDSCMAVIPHIEKPRFMARLKDIGEKIAGEISKLFPPPMKLEFEKVFEVFFPQKPKIYSGMLMGSKEPMYKGNPAARRDNCEFLRRMFKKTATMVMDLQPKEEVEKYIMSQLDLLMDGKVPFEDLVIIKKMGKNYKSSSFPLAVFNSNMTKKGEIINAGDRVEYVYVELEDGKGALQGDRMQSPKFFNLDGNTIDYTYYLTNVVGKPIFALFFDAYGYDEMTPEKYIKKIILPRYIQRREKMEQNGNKH